MVIQHNMLAMNANRQYKINSGKGQKIAEKLSSGYRINRSADDAAGLAMSEKMRRQVRGLGQAADNIQEGIGYVQTAEGALNEVHDMLQRMNELAVKSANGTNTQQDREYIDAEVQQLKEELDRIFDTTSFNERLIWEPKPEDRVQIATEVRQAVTANSTYKEIDVNNKNCGVIACGNYKINATEAEGVWISWTGYNGTKYETNKISWDELKEKDYTFDMSDYFKTSNTELFDNGTPVFKQKVSFNVEESATIKNICDSIHGQTFYSSPYATMSARFEDATGAAETRAVTVASTSLTYAAAYVSHKSGATGAHNFDAGDDAFIQALNGGANLTSAPTSTDAVAAAGERKGWTFTFEMAGIGKVTAVSDDIDYYGYDRTPDDEDLWWYKRWDSYNREWDTYIEEYDEDGTLAGVMNALTGDDKDTTPGLLNKSPTSGGSGWSDSGGYILLHFAMTSENEFTYGDNEKSKDVGGFTLRIGVSNTDTEQTVLDRINAALDNTAIFDLYSTDASNDGERFGTPGVNHNPIDVPIWGGKCKFWVQSGTEANQHIDIEYDALSTNYLRLDGIHVKDLDGCNDAIGRIKSAMIEVSKQRSNFGAYQNRLEHAYNANKNTQENTQASESRIRDTDMAKMMTEYSCNNILLQAGQAIMAQVNNANQFVLQLLQ